LNRYVDLACFSSASYAGWLAHHIVSPKSFPPSLKKAILFLLKVFVRSIANRDSLLVSLLRLATLANPNSVSTLVGTIGLKRNKLGAMFLMNQTRQNQTRQNQTASTMHKTDSFPHLIVRVVAAVTERKVFGLAAATDPRALAVSGKRNANRPGSNVRGKKKTKKKGRKEEKKKKKKKKKKKNRHHNQQQSNT
jgi:hypothetical protein